MSDRDNITLPREAVEKIHEAWSSEVYPPATSTEWYDIMDALRTALAAEQPRHPGYIIGSHWFEIAYERLCAGEAEDAILEDYELVREPRLRDLRRDADRYRWLRENTRVWPSDKAVWAGNQIGDAAIWIKQSVDWVDDASIDAAIDAAMEASTAPASAAADSSTAPEAKP